MSAVNKLLCAFDSYGLVRKWYNTFCIYNKYLNMWAAELQNYRIAKYFAELQRNNSIGCDAECFIYEINMYKYTTKKKYTENNLTIDCFLDSHSKLTNATNRQSCISFIGAGFVRWIFFHEFFHEILLLKN